MAVHRPKQPPTNQIPTTHRKPQAVVRNIVAAGSICQPLLARRFIEGNPEYAAIRSRQ
jgi:hypothetical protein